MGLVDDDELILVQRTLKMFRVRVRPLEVPELGVVREMFERQALDEQLVGSEKTLPCVVAERRRANEECALPPLAIELKDIASDEGFAEAHFVGDDDSAHFPDRTESAGDSMFLKAGEGQVIVGSGVFLDFIAVEALTANRIRSPIASKAPINRQPGPSTLSP